MHKRKMVFAKIRCIDRASRNLFDREFWLDTANLTAEQLALIERLCCAANVADFRNARPLFFEGARPDDFVDEEFVGFSGISVPDYFEDENGDPLDELGLM